MKKAGKRGAADGTAEPTAEDDNTTTENKTNNEGPKPGSAGTGASIRDGVHKLLLLTQKGDWSPVDQLLKTLEKAVAAAVTAASAAQQSDGSTQPQSHVSPQVNIAPLNGICDPVTGMTPLMYAVKDNRSSFIDRLIELGVDVSARNNDNYNALHVAAMCSREDVVKQLLTKRGVDVQATGGQNHQTPIHMVAARQTGTATSILRLLLNAAPKDIRLRTDAKGKIPLLLAVESGNQSMCRELLSSQTADQLRATSPDGDTALHLATRRRDLDMVRILIDYGANVDLQNGDGQTALHIASAEGDETLVKYFYGVRANASIADNQDRTPMHLAAENGHANVIELLADKFKASIFERTKDGSTLMHIASLNGHAECAMMLFKKGVYLHMPNKTGARSIHTAARYGHVGIINTLLQKGEKVDVTDNENYTALHIAVESCKPLVVETLLGYGADVHIRGGQLRETALHIAARVPDGDRCALMLLKSGAGANLTTDNGETAVHVAAKFGNTPTLVLLLEDGGDPLFRNNRGETPLHLASRSCKSDVVRQLIDFVRTRKGQDIATSYVNAVNDVGESALHYIARVTSTEVQSPLEDREIVRLLLTNGADSSIAPKQTQETAFHVCAETGNNDIMTEMISHMGTTDVQKALNRQSVVGWTPLLIACHKGHMELVNNLLTNHARVDVFDNEGRSALHLAADRGFLQVCDALLTHKAFINSKSRVGRTALHLAAMNGYTHLVRFLIKDHNAMIDVLTLRKQTPLHLAAAAGQLEVCRLLLELGASIDATDDQGQKPIHAAAMNNYSEVAQLFLQQHPSLVMANTKDGNTCAHIAAMQGSIRVIEELMKFDRQGVISARNRITEATPLQLAAEGGHAEVVKALVKAGASCTDENKAGFTAVHLAAQHGHGPVLEVMRSSQSLRISSKKLGVTALHVAAYFGQADTVRELLQHVPATVKSDPPSGGSLVGELGTESGMTPLHLAAYSGNENVVRLLLNSAGVQVDAATSENGYNPLHLACFGGHITVVGLLLSRSSDLLQSADKHGKTGLHIAATYGRYQMVEVLLGQGAEINATDKNGWTPLHCAARAGFLSCVRLLVESGASPKSETNYGSPAIWFAASEGHNDVLEYLTRKEHDTYSLMDDRRFVYNLMICGKNHNNQPIEDFVLVSPAPVDTAAKLSAIYMNLSTKEKERAKDLVEAGKQCETMATELLALAAGADSAGRILTALDRRNIEFLDVLIENEQKEVIAHTVVQRYLQELWRGSLTWSAWRTMLLFIAFIVCPPVWVFFTLPLGRQFYKVPIIKFMSYLTSHVYLMLFLMLVGITPIYPVYRPTLMPYWYEWTLLVWLSGLLLNELTNPSDKSGLGWIGLAVLLFGIFGVGLHLMGAIIERSYWPTLMYLRNQLFALAFLLACVQILDFLSFHHLFGPWAIIIGNLMKDLARFLAVLAIFVFGFSMHIVALNQPFRNLAPDEVGRNVKPHPYGGTFGEGLNDAQEVSLPTETTKITINVSLWDTYTVPPDEDDLVNAEWFETKELRINDTLEVKPKFERNYRPGGTAKRPGEDGPARNETEIQEILKNFRMNPLVAFELLFFAVFGQTQADNLQTKNTYQPPWTLSLFKITGGLHNVAIYPYHQYIGGLVVKLVKSIILKLMRELIDGFKVKASHLCYVVTGIYMLVSVVVLINLLIAMMSDTYQRIQAQSDIEWKYGLAKLIRNMHRTTTTPSPLNLVTTWFMVALKFCKQKVAQRKRPSLVQMMGLQSRSRASARTKVATKWLAKVKKGQVAPKDSVALSVVHLSPLGSQLSFSNATRIENVADWEAIAKKYRQLMGEASADDRGRDGGSADPTASSVSLIPPPQPSAPT